MPENVKWDFVFRSIVDTWLPLLSVIAAVIIIAVVIHFIKKKRKNGNYSVPSFL